MLPPVYNLLKATATITNVVGTNPPRIYAHGEAPGQVVNPPTGNPKLAYITWLLVSGVPENNLSDPSPVGRQSVQIDCWHETGAGINSLAEAVRDQLETVTHITSYRNMPRDPETRRYRISIDADFWGR
jgi:predicted phosphoadenosine phosphosulfate sulfurtransferase